MVFAPHFLHGNCSYEDQQYLLAKFMVKFSVLADLTSHQECSLLDVLFTWFSFCLTFCSFLVSSTTSSSSSKPHSLSPPRLSHLYSPFCGDLIHLCECQIKSQIYISKQDLVLKLQTHTSNYLPNFFTWIIPN